MPIAIDTSVQYLKGVGPKLGAQLGRRGIHTVGDLLHCYPRAYEDRRAIRNISSLREGQVVSLVAEILGVRSFFLGKSRKKIYEMLLKDESGKVVCKYFRIPHRGYFDRFQSYDKVRVVGKVTNYRGRLEFHHPEIHHIDGTEEEEDSLVPLYSETEGINPAKIRKLLALVLDELEEKPPHTGLSGPLGFAEALPSWINREFDLLEWPKALREIHQPPQYSADLFLNFKSQAQKRLIFEEFFWMEMLMAQKKAQISGETSTTIIGKDPTRLHLVSRIVEGLEFNLTSAQKRALNEIVSDLRRPFPMHRLVQGDVGCGKTMVALLASAHVVESGLQVSLMVPTEILAEQHFKTFRRILEPLGVQVGLLLGKMKVSEKAEIYSQISSGTIQILIGTQALIQTGVSFNKLGLVIVDEQHRFGVIQRSNLKQKGGSPHFLVMTATPIPRSLAMTVYGDLDVSVIDELPKGRQAVLTRVTDESKRNLVWNFVEKQVLAGRQAYIVYPLVEESEKLDLQNAQSGFENLKKRFPQLNVGLLHGKMKAEFKEQVMSRFRDGEIQVLVATSVVEVGVDVPNANIIIVEHAERFGLSQLHQLRGRVGRGLHKSYCVLVLGRAVSRESRQRIGVLEQTTDGFRVAEEDLRIRGSGEIFGTRQSGLSGFRLAQLGRDQIILEQAREAAFKLIAMDPHLERSDHQRLKRVWETKKTQTLG